jgi:hypothetical protein
MRTKFRVMQFGMTITSLMALAIESGAARKFA